MRTAWKGTLTFGLLAIPLRMGKAVEDPKSLFHQMHAGCGGRIRHQRCCEACPATNIEMGNIAKGIETADGTMIAVTDGELGDLRSWEPKTIRLLHFCQAAELGLMMPVDSYYVEPVDGGGPAHQLLYAAMSQAPGLVAVCEMAYPERVALAVMQQRDGMFVVTTLRWPEQIRAADVKIPPVQPPRPQEVKMAAALVKSMTRPFDPAAHADVHRQALVDLVMAKAAGAPAPAARVKDPARPYADMIDLLKASIDEQKKTAPARSRKTATAKAS